MFELYECVFKTQVKQSLVFICMGFYKVIRCYIFDILVNTMDSGNSKRLNSKPSLNSKRIFLVTPIVL